MAKMNWEKLLSTKRLGQELLHSSRKDDRSEFQRDNDRLVFSAPFRCQAVYLYTIGLHTA